MPFDHDGYSVDETTVLQCEGGEFVREFEVPQQYRLQHDESGTQVAGVRDNLAVENLSLSPDGTTGGHRGVPETLQIGETEGLVIERQYFDGVNEIQVYKAPTAGATESPAATR